MRYARNSSNFTTFANTRELFWKRLRLRGYPYNILLPLFRKVKYSNRNKWLTNSKRALDGKVVVFTTIYNCSHLNIKRVIQNYLLEKKCIISYKSTKTLASPNTTIFDLIPPLWPNTTTFARIQQLLPE